MIIHVVKAGETFYSISQTYNLSVKYLQNINQLPNQNNLAVGQTIIIAYPNITYKTEYGDTLPSIASTYNTSVITLLRNNPFLNHQILSPGDTLTISFKDIPLGAAKINGYVYPNVDKAYLRGVLPYLTYITIFTYGIKPDGTLIPTADEDIISLAKIFDVAALMHLSTLEESGTFSSQLGGLVLNDAALQDALIDNILTTMEEKGYSGLDIDFEFIPSSDSQNYVNFVAKLTYRLNANGYIVVAALAPKTSANQAGLLYEGHNYLGIGAAANYSFIMTYEWGYTYGPPMAIAPINKVREVLDYAVTEIPPSQILMGVPTYGYLWKLPYVRGETKATSLSNTTAIEIAAAQNAEIFYDEISQAPYYNFTDVNGAPCEVWFEDARSIEAKLKLIKEYGFAGAGYWNMDRPFPQNLMVLNLLYNILQVPLA